MIKRRTLCVLMVLLVAVSALTGCSSGKTSQSAGERTASGLSRENRQEGTRGTKDSGAQGDSSSQSQNQIIGKVTSIVGNEVELELGTMSGASGSSSGEFVSSGETKTLLIPVGLSLSGSGTGGTAQAGGTAAAGTGNAQQGGTPGGTAAGQTGTGTSANRSGSAKSGSTTKTTAGTATAGTTTKRTSGFSSITAGMVLRISQKEVNGTLTVVKVAVVSK